jgi:ribonucleotide monophosphatase NagD (HAD superfamily)
MDGTIYLGDHLFKGAKETFEYFKANDISFVFFD